MSPADPFCYEGFDLDPGRALLTCRYSLGGRDFAENITFGPGGNWDAPGVDQAARLICLLAGVSYYKTAAPPVIDLGQVPVTAAELLRPTFRNWFRPRYPYVYATFRCVRERPGRS